MTSPVYCALVHHPVRDRAGETVTTAVTTLDVHDIARSARTFGLRGYYVVTPIEAQHALTRRILEHWDSGAGRRRMPERHEALSICHPVATLQDAVADVTRREGQPPRLWTTAARSSELELLSFSRGREELAASRVPTLILFGTGHGLADSVLAESDALLEPIAGAGEGGYNHLSVRSAAAIVFDRLLGR
ncbi:MAG: RNA methyltransferase [Myxococcales bacterium]